MYDLDSTKVATHYNIMQILTLNINEEWLEQTISNDEDLFGSLVEQCNIHDSDDMNSESVLPTCTQQPHHEPTIDNSTHRIKMIAREWNVTPI